MEYPDGLRHALCALSFFKHRHDGRPRFRESKRHSTERVLIYCEQVRTCRFYIREAREAGFRGSIRGEVRKIIVEEMEQ